jgi:hypothetical protein
MAARVTDPKDELRGRQKSRALVTALALTAFVVLLYFITIAKMAAK